MQFEGDPEGGVAEAKMNLDLLGFVGACAVHRPG